MLSRLGAAEGLEPSLASANLFTYHGKMRWTLLTGLVVLAACRKPGATEVTKGDDTGDLTGFEGAIHFEGTSSALVRRGASTSR